MDNLIYKFYKEYGDYCNYRCLPLDIDGLKPVERRTLLSTYELAKDKFVKSARIDGYATYNYHPHGEIYGTLVQMVHQGFVIGQGNWGCSLGIDDAKAAAKRYTEARLNPNMVDLVFKLVNYVPWKAIDLDKEPIYFPAKYPICLLGNVYTTGIGFGYRTNIPCYEMEDLYKRLLYLLKIRKRKVVIKPKTDCEILSIDNELESLLTTGKAKIKLKGHIEIDVKNYKIILRSWPPGVTWGYILKKIGKKFTKEDIDWDDLSNGESGTEIVFTIVRTRNKKKTLMEFAAELENLVTANVSFDTIVVDIEKNVRRASIDELLLKSYENYKMTTNVMLNSEINRLNELKIEFEFLLKIRPFLAKHMNEIKLDFDKIVEVISKESKVPVVTIKLLFSKYKINKLLTLNVDFKSISDKIDELKNNLKKINDYVLKEYEL